MGGWQMLLKGSFCCSHLWQVVIVSALLSLCLGQAPNAPNAQQCGRTQTIWTNQKAETVTVTARFTDNCHEPEDMGNVTVYDQAGVQFGKAFKFSKGFAVTVSLDVPSNGRIDYICHPSAVQGENNCISQILDVISSPHTSHH
jgi:hypothetical protein